MTFTGTPKSQEELESWERCSHVYATCMCGEICMRIVKSDRIWGLEILQACFYNRLHLVSSEPPFLMDLPKHQRRRPSPEILAGIWMWIWSSCQGVQISWEVRESLTTMTRHVFPGTGRLAVIFWYSSTCKEGLKIDADFWDYLPFRIARYVCFRIGRLAEFFWSCKGLKIEADSEFTFRSLKDTATLTMGTPSVSYFISYARYVIFRNRKNSPFLFSDAYYI